MNAAGEQAATGESRYSSASFVALKFAVFCLATLLFGLTTPSPNRALAQVRDTPLPWLEVESEHFTIAYHEPLGALARRTAVIAERAYERLTTLLGHAPEEQIYIVITDGTDSANGSASSLPYNRIRLFASAPGDLSTLGFYDDWLDLLVTHEQVHVTHFDTLSGLPALINQILGKVAAPNALQPQWFIEGLAVYFETRLSGQSAAGRLRSSMFEMYLRMDALEGRLLSIDQLSNAVDRWPQGTAPYLYGAFFVEYIAERFGVERLEAFSHAYGSQLIPYGINRIATRVFGRSFIELYDDFLEELEQECRALVDQLEAEGLADGTPVTRRGDIARAPRWTHYDASGEENPSGEAHIIYYANHDGLDNQLRLLTPNDDERCDDWRSDCGYEGSIFARVAGSASPAPTGNGEVFFSALDTHAHIYRFGDLFVMPRSGRRQRLSSGLRARNPDVWPQIGPPERIAYTTNSAGTTHLWVADLRDSYESENDERDPGELEDSLAENPRLLLRNARFDQVYTPRFSPDGETIAVSTWRRGGFRDIALVDRQSGQVSYVTWDRAMDTGPAWSPDGRYLYFSSDRSGIANIYRYELESGDLVQVTRVISGAYSPDVSPDGQKLAYIGYTSRGFDVWAFDLDDALLTPAEPPIERFLNTPEPASLSATDSSDYAHLLPRRYRAYQTLLPRSYLLELESIQRGTQLTLLLSQSDIAEHYAYELRVGFVPETQDFNLRGTFTFARLRAPVTLVGFRRIRDRGGLVHSGRRQTWVEERLGAEVQVRYSIPRALYQHGFSAAYSVELSRNKNDNFGVPVDPNEPPYYLPFTGRFATLRAGYSFSDVRSRRYNMTPTAGRAINVGLTLSHPAIGSEVSSGSVSWSWRRYLEMPWHRHHSLALRYGGGITFGQERWRPRFAIGGFPNSEILDSLLSGATVGGVALRGYPVSFDGGYQLHQVQVEYRFPLFRIMRGLSTLPLYFSRVHAAIFVDAGDAFDGRFDLSTFRVGAGAELFADIRLGYRLEFQLRFGLAYGFMESGGLTSYFHIGTPF